MDPIAREWVDRILRAVEEHDDLIDVGPQFAGDRRLSQKAYEDTLRELSRNLWGNTMANLLGTAMDLRDVPGQQFWRNMILDGKDDELGMKLLPLLLPYLDLTALLCDFIAALPGATTDQKRRIANTLWYGCAGASLSLPTMDRFHMKEAIDVGVLRTALHKALPAFDRPTDRERAQAALAALTP